MTQQLEAHPFADAFPLMAGGPFADLKRDIAEHGVRQAIVVYKGLILDGRNRAAACAALGIEYPQEIFSGDDDQALAYVISTNLHRRHLNETQRAWVASKLASMPRGRPAAHKNPPIGGAPSQAEAAAMLNVSERSVQRAAIVRDKGVASLHDKVARGDIAVSVAAEIAKLPEAVQVRVVADERPAQAMNAALQVAHQVGPQDTGPSRACPSSGKPEVDAAAKAVFDKARRMMETGFDGDEIAKLRRDIHAVEGLIAGMFGPRRRVSTHEVRQILGALSLAATFCNVSENVALWFDGSAA